MTKTPGLLISAGFFSRIPVPPVTEVGEREKRLAISWFPVLGLLIGAVAGLIAGLVSLISPTQLIPAALALLAMQLAVGATHLDGLADSFDGLSALGSMKDGRTRAKALDIMHQPDTGAMGVVAIVLVLLLQASSLGSIPHWWGFIAVCALACANGRLSVVSVTRPGFPAARPEGFGALFIGATKTTSYAIELGLLTWLAAFLGLLAGGISGLVGFGLSVLLGQLLATLWAKDLTRRLGGLTGDLYGMLIESTTTFTMLICALPLH